MLTMLFGALILKRVKSILLFNLFRGGVELAAMPSSSRREVSMAQEKWQM